MVAKSNIVEEIMKMYINKSEINLPIDEIHKISKDYANRVSSVMETVHQAQKIMQSLVLPRQEVLDVINKQREIYEQFANAIKFIDLPKIFTGDILNTWAIKNPDTDDYLEDPTDVAEEIGYDIVDSVEEIIDEKQPEHTVLSRLELTSNGVIYLVEAPKICIDLTPQMEFFLRQLKKTFTKTSQLVSVKGYTTIRSIQAAKNKINRLARNKLNLETPLIVGIQGKGYKFGKHVQIHKLPTKILR